MVTKKIKSNLLRQVTQPSVIVSPYSYPSQGLTPQQLASVLQAADAGDIGQQAEFFMEMEEKDPHLASVLATRKLAVGGLNYEVLARTNNPREKKIASWLQEAILYIENFDEAILDLMDAVGKGFSLSEITYEISEGSVWITKLTSVEQRRATFIDSETPGLVLDYPRLLTDNDPFRGEAIPKNKFVFFKHNARSGIATRAGLLRVCAYIYLFKNYTLKDWLISNERFAQPMRVGKYKPGEGEKEIADLKEAVAAMGVDAAAVISDNTSIELLEIKRSGNGDYQKFAEYCDRQYSKAVLGQVLTTEPGKTGSMALGKVQNQVRQDLVKFDAKALARKAIRSQILAPLVYFNFGQAPVPDFVFRVDKSEDLEKLANVYSVLINLGLPISKAHAYERFRVPVPEAGAELLPGPVSAPSTPGRGADLRPFGQAASLKMPGLGHNVTASDKAMSGDDSASVIVDIMEPAWREIMQPLLEPIQEMARSSHSLEELRGRLTAAFSDMDDSVLRQLVTRGTFLAEVLGWMDAGKGVS